MWTSTLDLDPRHVIPTKLLGLFWRGAYFSSFAPLQVQNLPRQPLPAANFVRVRNSLAGICGSDLHLIFTDGDFSVAPAALPGHSRSYPGHEVVGEVIEVGEDVHTLHVGDRVVFQYGPNCITAGVQPPCRSCAAGNYGLCENGQLPGPQPIGGGWSEEMLLHEQQLFRIPPDLSDEQAVLLEPASVAVHAVLRRLPRAGEHVLIIGAGTIGLLTLQVIHALAPDVQVNVMARHPFQVERVANMGAKIIYPENSYRQVQQATSAQLYKGLIGNKMLLGGYDVIFDTIGSKRTTHDSLRWTRAGGTVVMIGVNLHQMHIDLTPIWYQEINLIGTMGQGRETWPIGTGEQRSTFEITTELITKAQIKPDELITHRYMLSEYREALMDAKEKIHNRVIKVVFDFSRQPASVVPNVRAAARQQRITPAPSQPLVPMNEPAYPQPVPPAGTPEPVMPLSVPVAQEEEDTKTVVAPAMWQSPFHPLTPGPEAIQVHPDDYEESQQAATSPRHETFNVATQYGNLPGFQPDLEQLGIPEPPLIDETPTDKNHLDVNQVSDVNELNQVSEISDVNQVSDVNELNQASDVSKMQADKDHFDVDEVNEVQPDQNHFDVMVQPEEAAPVESKDVEDQAAPPAEPNVIDPSLDTTDDYPWAQFLTPQPGSEESQAIPADPSVATGSTAAEPSPAEGQALPDKNAEKQQSQVGDDTQTVVVSSPRRNRIKRKTA
ncbi:MAG: alcohol dehydrogenase catalytic domain-containing protein, partial [Ktedonobacteraceae bacterium]